MCAGVALGWFDELKEACEVFVKWEREVLPNEENLSAYTDHYNKWREVYPYLLSLADDGILPSMWRAPGT